MSLPLLRDFGLMLTKWKSALDPITANPIIKGQQLTGITINTANTLVSHNLGRMQQGWIITDINAAATIYRTGTFNSSYMILTASVTCVVNIWVF